MFRNVLYVAVLIGVTVTTAGAKTWTFTDPTDLDDFAPDRKAPTEYGVEFFDGDNRLYLGVFGNDQAASTFHWTQGLTHKPSSAIGGTWILSADLYLKEEWSAELPPEFRTDLWGETINASGQVCHYPIIGFGNTATNPNIEDENDINLPGGFQAWRIQDGSFQWFELKSADGYYGTWVNLKVVGSPNTFEYFINDELVFTDTNTNGTSALQRMFLQVKNFGLVDGEDVDYSAYYDNVRLEAVAPVPEPMTMLAFGSAVAGLGGYIRRRRRA
jgi:putative flippase GtrA